MMYDARLPLALFQRLATPESGECPGHGGRYSAGAPGMVNDPDSSTTWLAGG